MKTVRHLEGLMFSVVAEQHENGCSVSYIVFQTLGVDEQGVRWWIKDRDGIFGMTSNIDEADVYLHGFVKWDGCSNWYFDEQDHAMIHFCGRRGMKRVSDLLFACFDMTEELIPDKFDRNLAGGKE